MRHALSAAADAKFTGGNDTLTGGSGVLDEVGGRTDLVKNTLTGDVNSAGNLADFTGGNDTLISGKFADDIMTGDWGTGAHASATGGEDTFVFGPSNGADLITDFEKGGKDTINLEATVLVNFTALDKDAEGNADGVLDNADIHVTVTAGGDTIIDLGAAAGGASDVDTIRVSGVTGLTAADFDFDTVIDPLDALV